MNALLMDNLQGVRQIKSFAREPHEDTRFANRADDLRTGTLGIMRVWSMYSPAMGFAASLGMGLVLWVGGWQVLHDKLTLGQLIGQRQFQRVNRSAESSQRQRVAKPPDGAVPRDSPES